MKTYFRKRLALLTLISILLSPIMYADTCLKPFPQAVTYPYGIKPDNFTQAQMNQHCIDWFNKWRAKYVTSNNCPAGQYRVQRLETGDTVCNLNNDTVSEGIAYGMVIMVYMSSATINTKAYFDGMWRYYSDTANQHMNGNGLMNWRINPGNNQVACNGGGAATDADEDVAVALIMADKQWGSAGAINYRQEALTLIGNVLDHEITGTNDIAPGDGWTDPKNPSYFAPYEYRMFGDYSGTARWYSVASRSYQTFVNYYYNSSETYNSALGVYTGMQPNWCGTNGGASSPGAWSMDYNSWWWDAIRHAWRQGYDYVLYGTTNHQLAYDNSARLARFFNLKTGGKPEDILSHYTLNGNPTVWSIAPNPQLAGEDILNLPGVVGAVAVAAMSGEDQVWMNKLYDRLVNMDAGMGPGELTETGVVWGTDYFCDILKMQYLLVLTGNMPNPLGDYPTPTPTFTWDTRTPTPTPVGRGIFDDFETGNLLNPETAESDGAVLTVSSVTEDKFSGLRSLKGATTGGAWAIFSIDSPYAGGTGYRNYTGATTVEFDIKAPAGTVFFIELEEAVVAGVADGERFSNRTPKLTKAGTGWQHFSVSLSAAAFTQDTYSVIKGNDVLNLAAIKSFLLQIENPGTQAFYVDNIEFIGTFPTYTTTPSATRTRTPFGSATNTPTITRTATNTPFYSPTITPTFSSTMTNTPYYSPTITPTYTSTVSIPFGVFDNFETTILESPDQSGDGCVPTYSNSAANPHAGARSLLVPFAPCAPGGWGSYVAVGSPYNNAVNPDFWISFAGATTITFWVNAPAGTVFFIKIEEWDSTLGGTNPDGEDFASGNLTKVGTGWQQFTVTLNTMTQYPNSGRQGGNDTLNTNGIERVGFQFNGGTTGPVYIDDIAFAGMPTPTFTRTSTRTPTGTRTPSFTVTTADTQTYTFTPVNTVTLTQTTTFTPTRTVTATVTHTGTIIIFSATYTPTHTLTYTLTPTTTFTLLPTNTNTYTVTSVNTATLTWTRTFTPTVTLTNTVSPTGTLTPTGTPPTSTITPTLTVTYTYTPTYTMTVTETATLTHTLISTATPTFTSTFTATVTVTLTNTPYQSPTNSPTGTPPTLTFTLTVTRTNTFTPTFTATNTMVSTAVNTAIFTSTTVSSPVNTATLTATAQINTPTATPTATKEPRFFEITEPVLYPCPYNPRFGTDLSIKIKLNKGCSTLKLTIYTSAYRRIYEKESTGNFSGDTVLTADSEDFTRLSNGTYFYVITGETYEAERASTGTKPMIIIKFGG